MKLLTPSVPVMAIALSLSCGGMHAVPLAESATVDCENAANETTSSSSSLSPSPSPAEPVTLVYSEPAGCHCKAFTLTMQEASAQTVAMCAKSVPFYLTGTKTQMNSATYYVMGCFVGKETVDQASYASCTQAETPTRDSIELHDDSQWDQSNIHLHKFVACVDQFGRTYAQRNEPVPTSATPTPARPRCNTTTPAATPKATTATTNTEPSGASSLNAGWSLPIIALYLVCSLPALSLS